LRGPWRSRSSGTALSTISQRDLADRRGMKQPQGARLALGEDNPSIETLMRLSAPPACKPHARSPAATTGGSWDCWLRRAA
jgi:hypothetical protein